MMMNFDLPLSVDLLLIWQRKSQLFADVAVDIFLPHQQKVNKMG
jgi:hypothetical protein